MQTRAFTLADLGACVKLYERVYEQFDPAWVDQRQLEGVQAELTGSQGYVTLIDQRIVGMGFYEILDVSSSRARELRRVIKRSDQRILVRDDDVYLKNLIVDANHRRRGIARNLIEARLQAARSRQAKNAFVKAWLRGGSNRILSQLGFEELLQETQEGEEYLYMYKSL